MAQLGKRSRVADTGEAKDSLVLLHVDSVEGMRLVTLSRVSPAGDAAGQLHHLVRPGGKIAGIYEGRVQDGLYRLVEGCLQPYETADPHQPPPRDSPQSQ